MTIELVLKIIVGLLPLIVGWYTAQLEREKTRRDNIDNSNRDASAGSNTSRDSDQQPREDEFDDYMRGENK